MKTLTKTILALALIVFASANLMVTSDSALESELKDGYVADWERAKTFTLQYIDAMPADQFGYSPTEDVRSFQAQMLHIAQGNIGLVGWATGAEKIYPDIQNFETEESFQGKEAVRNITVEVYDWCIDAIKAWDMSNAAEVVGPNENFSYPRMEWMKKGFEHQTHHRGQTTVYLRMEGLTPPPEMLF